MHELLEVERQRRRGDVQLFGDRSRRKPARPALDEKSENVEAGLLREGAESSECLLRVHRSTFRWAPSRQWRFGRFHISNFMEIWP
jgi:hypothetical protein